VVLSFSTQAGFQNYWAVAPKHGRDHKQIQTGMPSVRKRLVSYQCEQSRPRVLVLLHSITSRTPQLTNYGLPKMEANSITYVRKTL
jgi:hypothetical protein